MLFIANKVIIFRFLMLFFFFLIKGFLVCLYKSGDSMHVKDFSFCTDGNISFNNQKYCLGEEFCTNML